MSAAKEPAAKEAAAKEASGAAEAERMAKIATSYMFPWERRALDGEGGKLSFMEKAYWVFFVGALGFLGARMLMRTNTKDGTTEDERDERDAARKQRALAILRGDSIIGGSEDPFDGLTPEEIEAFVRDATKHDLTPELYRYLPKLADDVDEFEGMSPEEINAHLAAKKK